MNNDDDWLMNWLLMQGTFYKVRGAKNLCLQQGERYWFNPQQRDARGYASKTFYAVWIVAFERAGQTVKVTFDSLEKANDAIQQIKNLVGLESSEY